MDRFFRQFVESVLAKPRSGIVLRQARWGRVQAVLQFCDIDGIKITARDARNIVLCQGRHDYVLSCFLFLMLVSLGAPTVSGMMLLARWPNTGLSMSNSLATIVREVASRGRFL
jgi:hypothetical protein